MVDPISVASLAAAITAVVQRTAGEAGKQAWNTLAKLVQKSFGRHSPPCAELELIGSSPDEEQRILELASVLAGRAREQPSFADELAMWLANVEGYNEGEVANVVAGRARVQGPVLQGRNFTGSIIFGAPPSNQ